MKYDKTIEIYQRRIQRDFDTANAVVTVLYMIVLEIQLVTVW